MLSRLPLRLLAFILPPRQSERAVASLAPEDLFALQGAGGLPYSNEDVRALVWELKYYANPRAAALAGALLAEELLAIAGEEPGRPLLVPVPMHASRRRARGHNQTELLCEAALRQLGGACEYAPGALRRTRAAPEQRKLPRTQRLSNLKHSMRAEPALVKGRACVVIDDVRTTGATLNEAARALKEAGAARVHAVTLAQS
jgi:ComF family protein